MCIRDSPSTEDILAAIQSVPAKTVLVLPNNKNIIMASEPVSYTHLNSVTSSRSAIENLLKQAGDGLSISSQTVKTDLTQFKQNLRDTTGDASDPNATKQPDGAIIDPGYSIGDLTGRSSEEETTAAALEESADTRCV